MGHYACDMRPEWFDDEKPPKREKADEPKCPYCGNADRGWLSEDLLRGKRYRPNLLEYHCRPAFFGAQ